MAKWWEKNCWKPILSGLVGTTCDAPDPAPSGYLVPEGPPAKQARVEELRPTPATPAPPAVDASRGETLQAGGKKCASCKQTGHQWWDNCPVKLKDTSLLSWR